MEISEGKKWRSRSRKEMVKPIISMRLFIVLTFRSCGQALVENNETVPV